MSRNTESYGIMSRLLHWSMAIAVVAMFALGLWMRSLDYYSPYYKTAPDIHKSIGLILLAFLVFRAIWNAFSPKPTHDSLTPFERRASKAVHFVLYAALFVLMIAGYFISTADGRPISIFGLVDVPSILTRKGMESLAGSVHYYVAFFIIAVASVHALAALYHHFIKRDGVLLGMLRRTTRNS